MWIGSLAAAINLEARLSQWLAPLRRFLQCKLFDIQSYIGRLTPIAVFSIPKLQLINCIAKCAAVVLIGILAQ